MLIAVVAPVVIITLLGVTFILIPSGVGERGGFLSTLVLSEVMFLVMITSFVPVSKNVPLIALLFLAYLTLLVIMSVIVICHDSRVIYLKRAIDEKNKIQTEVSIIEFDTEKNNIV
jgi:hypothetical protein